MKQPDERSEYLIRRPEPDDLAPFEDFALDVMSGSRRHVFAGRWWWRDTVPHCWIVEHQSTKAIAAICGSRRSRFRVHDRVYEATSICDWYVSPNHKRKGLGRALVQESQKTAGLMYTSSISESAAVGFGRLGWMGDARYPMLLAPPWLVLPLASIGTGGIETRSVDIKAGRPVASDVWEDVEQVWAETTGRTAAMVRDAAHLQLHFRLAGVDKGLTNYRLILAYEAGRPVGWLLTRITARGAIRSIPMVRWGLVSDFLTPPQKPGVLRALVGAAARYHISRAELLLSTGGDPRDLRVFDTLGFLSPRTPIVGQRLATRLATRTMVLPPEDQDHDALTTLHITFADNDTDLILRASPG